jgi:thiosulfate/3-mercaptopyruvate sulfurtransferase
MIYKKMNGRTATLTYLIAITALIVAVQSFSPYQSKEPWKEIQLIQPAALAKIINDPSAKKPFIISVSPEGIYNLNPGKGIKGAVEFGAAEETANLSRLKANLSKMPGAQDIVVYCGCCPFRDCPNIRPAFKVLNEMKFKNHKLLDLKHNIKEDWMDKGYPMNE